MNCQTMSNSSHSIQAKGNVENSNNTTNVNIDGKYISFYYNSNSPIVNMFHNLFAITTALALSFFVMIDIDALNKLIRAVEVNHISYVFVNTLWFIFSLSVLFIIIFLLLKIIISTIYEKFIN